MYSSPYWDSPLLKEVVTDFYNQRYTFNTRNLKRVEEFVNYSLEVYPRASLFRFDLMFPAEWVCYTEQIMNRFFKSLNSKLLCSQAKRVKDGLRVHLTKVGYVWAKEIETGAKSHYHLAILVNKDSYAYLGDYSIECDSLAGKIQQAWASALGLSLEAARGLVHFPENPYYHLEAGNWDTIFPALLRLAYLTKETGKAESGRSFGTSRISRG